MTRSISLILLSLSALGCVVFPIDVADEEPFSEEVISSIEIGKSSQSDLESILGQPQESFLAGRWWVYRADHKTTEWMAIGYGTGGVAGGEIKHLRMLVRFDDEGLISALTHVSAEQPCDTKYGVCYIDGSLVLPVIFSGDVAARSNTCAIVFFADGQFDSTILVSIGDSEPQFPLVKPSGTYIYGNVPIGRHKITTDFDAFGVSVTKAKTVDCFSQETIYLSLDSGRDPASSLSQVAEQTGQQRIRGRKVRLIPDVGFTQ